MLVRVRLGSLSGSTKVRVNLLLTGYSSQRVIMIAGTKEIISPGVGSASLEGGKGDLCSEIYKDKYPYLGPPCGDTFPRC